MSIQLEFLEQDISQQLYSMRGWMGRMQNKLERIARQQELIINYRDMMKEKVEATEKMKPKIVQLEMI